MLFIGRQALGKPNAQTTPSLKQHAAWEYLESAAHHKCIFWLLHPHSPRGPTRQKVDFGFKNQLFFNPPIFCSDKIGKLKEGHCRDPSLRDTWHASYSDTWHALSFGSSYKAHMTRFSHPDCLKEEQTTLTKHRHPDGFHKCVRSTIHPDNQHGLSGYDCPDHWLK